MTLTNPWRAASRGVTAATATLSTLTAGVTIYDDTASYGAIAPTGSASGADTFTVALDPGIACGSSIDFTLATSSDLGAGVTGFRLRVGGASGTDPVVTYTDSPSLAIPDGRPRAAFTTMTITDDYEIADLDFRVDSLTHPYDGDVSVMLRSPNGLGVDLVTMIGWYYQYPYGSGGSNLTNMVIDDDVAPTNDMVLALSAGAPYTGSWVPAFNGYWPALLGLTPDPVGNLSRFDGLSTEGTWAVAVADQFTPDSGTLNTYSLLVTPVHFACSPVVAAASVSATKTVSGDMTVGGVVTYTVTLTNSGTAAQGDNAGAELTDVLPAELTLTGASATSGSVGVSVGTNTVIWNGSLGPLGGSVTITITATVNAGTQGDTVVNQGTVSYDSNDDATNDASVPTDDPTVGGAADPTTFLVGGAHLTATKTASGTFQTGSAVTYTIVISNDGGSASADNGGDELTDVLPAALTLTGASASSGTAVATLGTNTVTWNGSVPAGGSVTVTITATVEAGHEGETIANQASVAYDADDNGSNETTVQSDDPGAGGSADPTLFVVGGLEIEVPTLSPFGLAGLIALLLVAGWLVLRRRSVTA